MDEGPARSVKVIGTSPGILLWRRFWSQAVQRGDGRQSGPFGTLEIDATQCLSGTHPTPYNDLHGLDHRNAQRSHPLGWKAHDTARHWSWRLWQGHRDSAIVKLLEKIADLPAPFDTDQLRRSYAVLQNCCTGRPHSIEFSSQSMMPLPVCVWAKSPALSETNVIKMAATIVMVPVPSHASGRGR